MNSANLNETFRRQKFEKDHLPDRALEFPDSLPGFTLRTSAIFFQLFQSLPGLNHTLRDELLLRQKFVLWPEEGLDDRRPSTRLDAAWDRSPGEEKDGNQERGSLEKNELQHWMPVHKRAFHCNESQRGSINSRTRY